MNENGLTSELAYACMQGMRMEHTGFSAVVIIKPLGTAGWAGIIISPLVSVLIIRLLKKNKLIQDER